MSGSQYPSLPEEDQKDDANEPYNGDLLAAVEAGNLPAVQYLLNNHRVLIDYRDHYTREDALALALEYGHTHIAIWILENAEVLSKVVSPSIIDGMTSLLGCYSESYAFEIFLRSEHNDGSADWLKIHNLLIALYTKYFNGDVDRDVYQKWILPAFVTAIEEGLLPEEHTSILQPWTQALFLFAEKHNNFTVKIFLQVMEQNTPNKTLLYRNGGYLLLDDVPEGFDYMIGTPALNTSGDVYHMLSYTLLAQAFGCRLPSVVFGHDTEATALQAGRAVGFAELLGFQNIYHSVNIPTGGYQPNTRLANLRKRASQAFPFHYLVDQKATTLFLAKIFQQHGFERTTYLLRDLFLRSSAQTARVDFPAQMEIIENWVEKEFRRIQQRAAGRRILLFNKRVASAANADQDIGNQFLAKIEETVQEKNIFLWYLIANSKPKYRPTPGSNETCLFNMDLAGRQYRVDLDADARGLYKLRHILLLIRILGIPNLIGMAGNTSGTLDIAAFLGHRVYSFHVFSPTRGNNYLDAQHYRILIQHRFLSIGLPITGEGVNVDNDGACFDVWLDNASQENSFPRLSGLSVGIPNANTPLKYKGHSERLPFSGALTWPLLINERRNLSQSPELKKLKTNPRFVSFRHFDGEDQVLRRKLAGEELNEEKHDIFSLTAGTPLHEGVGTSSSSSASPLGHEAPSLAARSVGFETPPSRRSQPRVGDPQLKKMGLALLLSSTLIQFFQNLLPSHGEANAIAILRAQFDLDNDTLIQIIGEKYKEAISQGMEKDEVLRAESQVLRDHANAEGFTVTEIERAGNCLYLSVADQLARTGGEWHSHDDLRNIAAAHLIEHREDYFYTLEDAEAAQRNFYNREWAGQEAIVALSRLLRRTVVVLHQGAAPVIIKQHQGEGIDQVLFLGFEGHHYQSLLPRAGEVNQELLDRIREAPLDTGIQSRVALSAAQSIRPLLRSSSSSPSSSSSSSSDPFSSSNSSSNSALSTNSARHPLNCEEAGETPEDVESACFDALLSSGRRASVTRTSSLGGGRLDNLPRTTEAASSSQTQECEESAHAYTFITDRRRRASTEFVASFEEEKDNNKEDAIKKINEKS